MSWDDVRREIVERKAVWMLALVLYQSTAGTRFNLQCTALAYADSGC